MPKLLTDKSMKLYVGLRTQIYSHFTYSGSNYYKVSRIRA